MKNAASQENPNGRWKKAEHDRFLKGLEKYGRDWVKVQKMVKSRSLAQVRSHAQKCFKDMSSDDIEAYFAEDKEYACNSFGRIKMNREKMYAEEKPLQAPKATKIQDDVHFKGENLLDILKRALENPGKLVEKINIDKLHCPSSQDEADFAELSAEPKRPSPINAEETEVSLKNPFHDPSQKVASELAKNEGY